MESFTLPIRYKDNNRVLLNDLFDRAKDYLKPYFVEHFRQYKHLYTFTSEEQAYKTIGSIYLVLLLSVMLCIYEKGNNNIANVLKDNFYFVMMYSLVDTLLDTNSENKEDSITLIKSILYKKGKIENATPVVEALYNIYAHFSDREEVVDAMKISFMAEYKSYLIQYNPHTEEVYNDVCENLGYTMYNLFRVINNIPGLEKYDRIVGYCGQIGDDVADIDEDISAGINTIVTFIYQRDGNIDKLYYHVLDKIDELPDDEHYSIIKCVIMYGFNYVINKSKYISDNIKSETKKNVSVTDKIIIDRNMCKELHDLL